MDPPRDYQVRLFEQALKDDVIIVLPTGSGKTRIATMLINERFRSMSSSKVIFFLAPKRSLVEQQLDYIQRHMELPNIKVNGYTGLCLSKVGVQIDHWSEDVWKLETASYRVLVITPELLKNALIRCVLSIESIDTIIFDECQHARGKSPMAEICRYLDQNVSYRPKILGLTATGMNTKKGTVDTGLQELEFVMKCKRAIVNLSDIQDPIRPMPTSVGVLNKECLSFNSSDIDKDAQSMFAATQQFSLINNSRICGYFAYKRIHLTFLMCKLYRSLRTIHRSPNGHHITATLKLPDQIFRLNSDSGHFNAMDNVHSELYGILDRLYRGTRAVERFGWDYGSIPGLYGIREALLDQSLDESSNPAIAFMFGKSSSTNFDDDAMKALVDELEKSIFPLQLLLEAEKCFCASLIEFALIFGQGLSDATYDKALEILHSRGSDTSNIGIVCIKLLRSQRDIFLTTQSLSVLNAFPGIVFRLDEVRQSLLRMYNALIDSLNKPVIQQLINSTFCVINYESLTSLRRTDFGGAQNTKTYPMITNKIKILVRIFQQPPTSSADSDALANRSIVFCETRLSAAAISNFLSDFLSTESLVRLPSPDLESISKRLKSSLSLTGTLSYTVQNSVLKSFKLGESTVLVATNVAEEGIDVQTCNLVINLEIPHTFNSFIQRRGRARSLGSFTVYIIDMNKLGHDDLTSLLQFDDEERRMMNHFNLSLPDEDASSKKVKKDNVRIYQIESTGASIDSNSSVSLLYAIFQQMDVRRDQYYETRPILVTQRITNPLPLFRCSILLPNHIPSNLRCFVGPDGSSKIWTEGVTALECIKKLHIAQIIDDNFNVKKDAIVGAASDSGIRNLVQSSGKVSIKIVPDIMVAKMNRNPSLTVLYIYCFSVNPPDSHNEDCRICRMRMDGITDIGIAYSRPLPAELLNTSIPTTIEGCHGPQLQLQYMGKKYVTTDVLNILFRYHRAIACWTTTCPEDKYCLSPREFIEQSSDKITGIDASVWGNSAHGAWYVAYPPSAYSIRDDEEMRKYLSKCANDAELLVHNLWILEKLKRNGDRTVVSKGDPWLNSLDTKELPGYLVTVGRSQISIVIDCQDESMNDGMNKSKRNLLVHGLSSRLSLFPLLMYCAEPNGSCHKESHLSIYSTPDDRFTVLGNGRWYFAGLMFPSLTWRIQSLCLAIELRDRLNHMIRIRDPENKVICAEMPQADVMLEALTPRRCLELIQYERFEFLGDSFLKFIVSVELYHLHHFKNEGYLSYQREQYISNQFLASICQQELLQYLRATPLSIGKAELCHHPPGMVLHDKSLWNDHVVNKHTVHVTDNELAIRMAENPNPDGRRLASLDSSGSQYIETANIRAKEPADLVESIIGAYFLSYGVDGAKALVDTLGILPKPSQKIFDDKDKDIGITIPEGFADELKELVSGDSPSLTCIGKPESYRYSSLEKKIGYCFNKPDILQEAVTHVSFYSEAHNQRLEFLGDAVLDFAIIQLMFHDESLSDEGLLTKKKESAVNNHRLCQAAIDIGLHHVLRAREPLRNELQSLDETLIANAQEIKPDDTIVKPLADAFEALIGAIFLDNDGKFDPIFHMISICNLLDRNDLRMQIDADKSK